MGRISCHLKRYVNEVDSRPLSVNFLTDDRKAVGQLTSMLRNSSLFADAHGVTVAIAELSVMKLSIPRQIIFQDTLKQRPPNWTAVMYKTNSFVADRIEELESASGIPWHVVYFSYASWTLNKRSSSAAIFSVHGVSEMAQKCNSWKLQEKQAP